MPKKYRKHKKNKSFHFSYNEKILYLVSIIITLILSLLISIFTGKDFSILKKSKRNDVPYTGSAVRKESVDRQNYEKYYREKQELWNDEYQDILRNNEEIKELDELDFERKKKK